MTDFIKFMDITFFIHSKKIRNEFSGYVEDLYDGRIIKILKNTKNLKKDLWNFLSLVTLIKSTQFKKMDVFCSEIQK